MALFYWNAPVSHYSATVSHRAQYMHPETEAATMEQLQLKSSLKKEQSATQRPTYSPQPNNRNDTKFVLLFFLQLFHAEVALPVGWKRTSCVCLSLAAPCCCTQKSPVKTAGVILTHTHTSIAANGNMLATHTHTRSCGVRMACTVAMKHTCTYIQETNVIYTCSTGRVDFWLNIHH